MLVAETPLPVRFKPYYFWRLRHLNCFQLAAKPPNCSLNTANCPLYKNTELPQGQPRFLEHMVSESDTLNFAATQAASAYEHTGRSAVNHYANTLGVRSPGATDSVIGMADVVAGNYTLMAYLTKLAHCYNPLFIYTHNVLQWVTGAKNKASATPLNLIIPKTGLDITAHYC